MSFKRIAVSTVIVLLALEFGLAGLAKFRPGSTWPQMFLAWGFPPWVRPVIGTLEVIGAVGLLIARTRAWACGVLLGVMAGAIATHLVHGEMRRVILPFVLSVLLGLVGFLWCRASDLRSQP